MPLPIQCPRCRAILPVTEDAAEKTIRCEKCGTGVDSSSQLPATADTASDLNNKGVNLVEIGRPEEAERLFEEALQVEPQYLEATYNLGLLRWRTGRITDEAVIAELEEACDWHPNQALGRYLLLLVHAERGDAESARSAFEAASQHGLGGEKLQEALELIREGDGKWGRCVRQFPGDSEDSDAGRSFHCFSSDGRWAVSTDYRGFEPQETYEPFQLWDVATGRSVCRFGRLCEPPSENGQAWKRVLGSYRDRFVPSVVCISPDGRKVLSGHGDGRVHLWDAESGRYLRTFAEPHPGKVACACFSPDGRWVLSGSSGQRSCGEWCQIVSGDPDVWLWEVETGLSVRRFKGHEDHVRVVDFSLDGKLAASASDDKTLRVWEVTTGKCRTVLVGHHEPAQDVRFSHDGGRILSGGLDGTLRLWDIVTGKCLRMFEGCGHWVNCIAFSPDDKQVSAADDDKKIRVWEVASGQCLRTFQGPGGACDTVSALSFMPDGRTVLSGGRPHVQQWRLPATSRAHSVPACVRQTTDAVAERLELEDALQRARESLAQHDTRGALCSLRSARSMPGGRRNSELLDLWHQVVPKGQRTGLLGVWCHRIIKAHSTSIYSVSIDHHGMFALSHSWDENGNEPIRLWNLATGECLRSFEAPGEVVTAARFSWDGKWILSAHHISCDDTLEEKNRLRVWDTATGHCLKTIEAIDRSTQWSLDISPDDRWAVSGGLSNKIHVWELPTGRRVRTLRTPAESVQSVRFSPDGRFALSHSLHEFEDNGLRLWELATGECVRHFKMPEEEVNGVCFSPDGLRVLSANSPDLRICEELANTESKLMLWEVATGRCLKAFEGFEENEQPESVSFSPDGQWVLSTQLLLGTRGVGRSTRLWEVETGRCIHMFKGHIGDVTCHSFSPDGRWILTGKADGTLQLFQLDWDLEVPDTVDWNPAAHVFLDCFLTVHTPYGGSLPQDGKPSTRQARRALIRSGKPTWTEEKFQDLLSTLRYAGYGWLRPEGVRRHMEEMAADWREDPLRSSVSMLSRISCGIVGITMAAVGLIISAVYLTFLWELGFRYLALLGLVCGVPALGNAVIGLSMAVTGRIPLWEWIRPPQRNELKKWAAKPKAFLLLACGCGAVILRSALIVAYLLAGKLADGGPVFHNDGSMTVFNY